MKTSFLAVCLCAPLALAQSPGTFTWSGSMTVPRAAHTATLLQNGQVLIAGGIPNYPDYPSTLASAELYNPATGTFLATGSMAAVRAFHAAVLLPDGTVLVAGGAADQSLERYDPAKGAFQPAGTLGPPQGDSWTTATLLANGQALVASSNVAMLYDPAAGTLAATGSMVYPHSQPSATLLADGRALFSEEVGQCNASPTTCGGDEIYDPASNGFAATGALGGRPLAGLTAGSTVNLLSNGMVLVAGGDDDDGILATAEVYDPSAGQFAPAANMTIDRTQASAVLLADGTVLIAGGGSSEVELTASAELYLPSKGTFAVTGNMTIGRLEFASTLLADGSVLLTGGLYGHPIVNTEIYHPLTPVPAPVLSVVWNSSTGQLITPAAPANEGTCCRSTPPA